MLLAFVEVRLTLVDDGGKVDAVHCDSLGYVSSLMLDIYNISHVVWLGNQRHAGAGSGVLAGRG